MFRLGVARLLLIHMFFISCCSCKADAVFSTRKKIPRTRATQSPHFHENVGTLSRHAQPLIVTPNVWSLFGPLPFFKVSPKNISKPSRLQIVNPTLFNKFVEPSPESVQQHIVNPNVPPFSGKCVGSCTTTYWANSENFYGHSWGTAGKIMGLWSA